MLYISNDIFNHFLLYIDEEYDIPDLDLFRLEDLLPSDTSKFYRYNGSLTTPGCYESVVWTVFANPIQMSKDQVRSLANALLKVCRHIIGDLLCSGLYHVYDALVIDLKSPQPRYVISQHLENKDEIFVLPIFDGVIMDGHPIFWVVDAGVAGIHHD